MNGERDRWVQYVVVSLAFGASIFCVAGSSIGQLINYPIQASGSWRSDFSGEGPWSASMKMEGNSLVGTMQFQGRPEASVGQVTGHLSGESIQLGVITAGAAVASFSGSLTAEGVAGTYQTSTGDRGVWNGLWYGDPPQLASNDWPVGVPTPQSQRSGLPRPLPRDRYSSAHRSPLSHPTGLSWWKSWRAARAYAQTVGANRLVNSVLDNSRRQNEPEIAVDWANSNRLVAGAIDYSFAGADPLGIPRLGAYSSIDGGANWTIFGQLPLPTEYAFDFAADPSVDFDANGRAFYGGLAWTADPNEPAVCSGSTHAVFVARSDNGGVNWSNGVIAYHTPAGTNRELDKPWLAVDKSPLSPHRNNVYIAWSQAAGSNCETSYIRMARSTDSAANFSTVLVSDGVAGVDSWPYVATAVNGDVNVIWIDASDVIKFDKCTNGGTTCGTDVTVAAINPPPNPLPYSQFRMSWIPTMAINNRTSGTPTDGYIYVVWNHWIAAEGQLEIYFSRSIDGGVNFSPNPVAITVTPEDEFFPAISVAPNNVIRVIYYRRTSPIFNTFNTYMILSGDGGQNWSAPIQLNDGGNIWDHGQNIGDYIGVDSGGSQSNSTTNAVWMDSRRNQQDIYSTIVTGC